MRKSFVAVLLLLLLCFSLSALAGCANSVSVITDIKDYAGMTSQTDRIEVSFDNNTGKSFKFDITDETEIHEIMDIVLNEKLVAADNGSIPPGDNTSITVHQGAKSYTLSVRVNPTNSNFYAFSTTNLQTKIAEIAEARGAYDIKVGVIYKVIDLANVESVQEIAETATTEEELSTLIKTNFDSEWKYLYVYEEDAVNSLLIVYGIGKSVNRVFNDTVTLTQNKLLVIYEIFKDCTETPYYYFASPTKSQYAYTGNVVSMEFVLGHYHTYKLNLSVVS